MLDTSTILAPIAAGTLANGFDAFPVPPGQSWR
ncbi:hypothetical protein RERY_38530 [Rhodococcus erythropolis]|nr:hypothetical protein RERY_38530 [Rhodococcus erythropolis]